MTADVAVSPRLAGSAHPQRESRTRWTGVGSRLFLLTLVVALLAAVGWRVASRLGGQPAYRVPQNAAMESALGVRFSQAALVADGGIVELSYTVLDAAAAATFQNDTLHPPTLRSEQGGATLTRTALMKQAHTLRPGQTYYILYLDITGAVHSGGSLEIKAAGQRLAHVPVR